MERLIFPVTKKEAEKSGKTYSSEENKNALFPSQLRELRKEKGISQETLARDLGVSKSTIGLYETGDTLPDAKTLRDLAVYFNVSSDYLVGLSDYEEKESEGITAQDMGMSEGFACALKKLYNTPGGELYIQVLNELAKCKNFSELLYQIRRYIEKLNYVKNEIDHFPASRISDEERKIRMEKFLVSDVLSDMLDELCPPPDWKAGKDAALSRSKKYREVLDIPENDTDQ